MLAHEAGGAVVVDDELKRLVKPTVGTVTVPVLVSTLLEGDRRGIIKADDEGGGLYGLESRLVLGAGVEEHLASVCPDIAVLGSQNTDSGDPLCELVDAPELGLELRGVKLLAADLVRDLEELVLADGDNVLVFVGSVLDGVVLGVCSDTASVEHPLIAVHVDRQLLHILGLKSASINHLLELKDRGRDGSCALGGVTTCTIISVGVEVADEGNDRVAVCEIGCIVPPLIDPVLGFGMLAPGDKLLL